MRGCGTDYGDKEIINVDGEDFELIKKEIDTVFVEKEIQVTKYVPIASGSIVSDAVMVTGSERSVADALPST